MAVRVLMYNSFLDGVAVGFMLGITVMLLLSAARWAARWLAEKARQAR